MIQSIRLQNFKALRDVEVGLERLTVFVGPNGSGKTSILQGLELLVEHIEKSEDAELKRKIFEYGICDKHSANQKIELSGVVAGNQIPLHIRLEPSNADQGGFSCERSSDETLLIDPQDELSPHGPRNSSTKFSAIAESLGRVELFRFESNRMAKPSPNSEVRLEPDGGGLASFLAFMALNRPENFSTIQQEFSQIIPSIKRIRFDRSQVKKKRHRSSKIGDSRHETYIETRDEIVFDLKNGDSISARAASEGTILVLGILAVLQDQNRQSNLILIDDLDRSFHPLLQREIVKLLRRVLDQQLDLQIVATTHSPYLVDRLDPEEVRLMALREDGTVACGRLEDHPDFGRWKDEYFPGELWTLFGEEWVASLAPEVAQ